ncbi:TPA: alpha-1,2-fucosyltransferase [Vibrio harveyi]|nr:alpha-1,2-fucosyltransferase [Vibrio harveyi]
MIRIKCVGGLGNQMFQYAAGFALSKKLGVDLLLDLSAFNSYDTNPLRINHFNISSSISNEPKFADKVFCRNILVKYDLYKKLMSKKYFFEKGLEYNNSFNRIKDEITLVGYFQSEKYFHKYRDEIKNEFTLIDELPIEAKIIAEKISNTNSIAVHVRRGDYITNSENMAIHGVCDVDYYKRAHVYLNEHGLINDETKFFIFSNDLDWCSENMRFLGDIVIVDGNSARPEIDMYLMSLAKSQIIANSTFSWWGAWLNENIDKTVVAPSNWFASESFVNNDMIPTDWVKI